VSGRDIPGLVIWGGHDAVSQLLDQQPKRAKCRPSPEHVFGLPPAPPLARHGRPGYGHFPAAEDGL